jgi:hypothetical protein
VFQQRRLQQLNSPEFAVFSHQVDCDLVKFPRLRVDGKHLRQGSRSNFVKLNELSDIALTLEHSESNSGNKNGCSNEPIYFLDQR